MDIVKTLWTNEPLLFRGILVAVAAFAAKYGIDIDVDAAWVVVLPLLVSVLGRAVVTPVAKVKKGVR